MEIKQALNRIYWRFGGNGNKNAFPVNENDIEAFEEIAKTVKEHQTQQYEQNEIFAKLYIFVYMRFISKMGGSVLDNEPRKQLHRILEKPIEHWIEEFRNEMNDNERYKSLEEAGLKVGHPALLTDSETEQNEKAIKKLDIKVLDDIWNFEDTKECLVAEINNVLNRYK